MKNISLLLLIFFAAIAAAGYGLYAYQRWTIGIVLLFTGVILGATALIMKKEINLWAQKKSGGTLNQKEIDFLERTFALQKYILPQQKTIFYQKVNLFVLDKEIIGQNESEKIYHPAVLLCGAYAAFFDTDSGLRIPLPSSPVYVFYGHPFPSPAIRDQLHITEYHPEDGAFLFSIPHLMKGNEVPDQFLNIALYETVKAIHSDRFYSIDFPDLETLCAFGGYTLPRLEKYIGLSRKHIDPTALAITLYFTHPSRFLKTFAEPGELLSDYYPLLHKHGYPSVV